MDDFSSFLVSNRPFARGYVIICNFTLIITGYYIHYLGLRNDSLFYHSYIAHPQRSQSLMLWKQELSFCSCYWGHFRWRLTSKHCTQMCEWRRCYRREGGNIKQGCIIHWAITSPPWGLKDESRLCAIFPSLWKEHLWALAPLLTRSCLSGCYTIHLGVI